MSKPSAIGHDDVTRVGGSLAPVAIGHDSVTKVGAKERAVTPASDSPVVSIVVPGLNEAESLPELARQVDEALVGTPYELIFVDDGSTDGSARVLQELRSRDRSRIKIIRFRRNYGKSAALSVGFGQATGEVVVTMDADLQDDPAEIPSLVNEIRKGFDLVSGWKKKRFDPITKTIPSRLFNFITSVMTGIPLHDFNCGLKAYRREVVDSITLYGELHRFIPVLANWEGFRVDELGVKHFKRKYGSSKYGAKRFLNGFFDLVTVMFVTRRALNPLHFFGRIAIALFTLGVIPQLYFFGVWLTGNGLRVRPIMLLGFVFIIVALQIASIGLLAEMISSRAARESTYAFREYNVRGGGPPDGAGIGP